MNSEEFHQYLDIQQEEILKYKWIRSEEEGHDVGRNIAAGEWIERYAARFSAYWVCQHCQFREICSEKEEGKNWV